MSDVGGSPAKLSFTIQITRADTGKVEEYILTSIDTVSIPEQKDTIITEEV